MNWFKKSLFVKLLAGMMIAAVVPFSLSSIISYQTVSNSVKQQIINLSQNSINIGMGNIKSYLNDLNVLTSSYFSDDALMRYLNSNGAISPVQSLYVLQQIKNIYSNRSEIRAVRYKSAYTGQEFTQADLGLNVNFQNIDFPKTEVTDWDIRKGYGVEFIGNERILSYNKLLINYPFSDVIGMTTLYIGLNEIGRISKILTDPSQQSAVFVLIQMDMQYLYGTQNDDTAEKQVNLYKSRFQGEKGAVNGKFNEQKGVYIYFKDQYRGLPLTLVKFVPNTTINESANKTLDLSVMIQFVSIAFVIVFATIISYLTIKPVKRILRTISRVESGKFDVDQIPKAKDELGILEYRFQTMILNLDDLLNREYRNKLELSTARLKVLQAQINPHFLYNTLQYLSTLALRHRAPEVSVKIAELGSIFRYNMDMQTEIVPLQKEVQHIEHYLSLQTGRFKDKLAYAIACPEEALSVYIPKMVLQPLVENSIVHGIEKGKGNGSIHLTIQLEKKLTIRVMDNGKGIDSAVIERIRMDYDANQFGQGSIGMLNVFHRLRLFYGSEFEWHIHSEPYQATVILLEIPISTSEGLQNGKNTYS